MNWVLHARKRVKKDIQRLPKKDQLRVDDILRELELNPYSGDIINLDNNVWRRRIGAYRIFYEILSQEKVIYIFRIERRTSKTY